MEQLVALEAFIQASSGAVLEGRSYDKQAHGAHGVAERSPCDDILSGLSGKPSITQAFPT